MKDKIRSYLKDWLERYHNSKIIDVQPDPAIVGIHITFENNEYTKLSFIDMEKLNHLDLTYEQFEQRYPTRDWFLV